MSVFVFVLCFLTGCVALYTIVWHRAVCQVDKSIENRQRIEIRKKKLATTSIGVGEIRNMRLIDLDERQEEK